MNKFLNYAMAVTLAASHTLWQLETWPTDSWWVRVLSVLGAGIAWWWLLNAAKAITSRDDLVSTLKACRDQFAFYAKQHRAKGTVEGHLKAKVNDAMVVLINKVLGA